MEPKASVPIIAACQEGRATELDSLLADATSLNITTGFVVACQFGHIAIIKHLLRDHKPDSFMLNHSLYMACTYKHHDIANLLLDTGASPAYALHISLRPFRPEITPRIVKACIADKNANLAPIWILGSSYALALACDAGRLANQKINDILEVACRQHQMWRDYRTETDEAEGHRDYAGVFRILIGLDGWHCRSCSSLAA